MGDPTGVTPELRAAVAKATAQGNELLPQMLAHVRAAPTQEAALLLAEIHSGMQRLYENFERDPRDAFVVRDFVDYYAANTLSVASAYVRQLSTAPDSPECAETKKTLNELLRVLVEEFMSKCLENDKFDDRVLAATVAGVIAVEHGKP